MPKRLTVDEYCKQNKTTVVERQPASMVPPAYRSKPVEEQIMSGVEGVDEVLFENGETYYTDRICDELHDSAQGVSNHLRKHKNEAKRAEEEREQKVAEAAVPKQPTKVKKTEEVVVVSKAEARRRTQQMANTDELTYAQLKEEVKKRDLTIRILRDIKDELEGKLQTASMMTAKAADHSKCYEQVGMTSVDKKVPVVRENASGKLFRAYPL
jgi:hypothetical protein